MGSIYISHRLVVILLRECAFLSPALDQTLFEIPVRHKYEARSSSRLCVFLVAVVCNMYVCAVQRCV